MIDALVVGLLVAGAAIFAGRKLLRFPRPRANEGRADAGCSCDGCPARRKRDCSAPRAGLPLLALALAASAAPAADTIECFPAGLTDVETYFASDGLGLSASRRTLQGQALVGFGLTDRLSTYLAVTSAGNGNLVEASTLSSLGLIVTPFSGSRCSADLVLEFANDPQSGILQIAPTLEVNYDQAPMQARWGLYLREAYLVAGDLPGREEIPLFQSTLGFYRALGGNRQLLLEMDGAIHQRSEHARHRRAEHRADLGGLAVGLNLPVGRDLELITQLRGDIPQRAGERFSAGVMCGLIATLGARSGP